MDNRNHTTIPVESGIECPFAAPFFLKIQHVRYEEPLHQAASIHGPDFYWRPSSSGRFVNEKESSWCVWDPGLSLEGQHLRTPTPQELEQRQLYMSSTLVWDPERHGYLHANIDCTNEKFDVDTWRRLSFGQLGSSDLAVIGHSRAGFGLHLPGPDSWFEQLLPDVCKAPLDGPPTCKLAGHLSIIVGLLAFGVQPHLALCAVDKSFRPNLYSTEFKPHRLSPSPRHKKRSMVIKIGYDPAKVSFAQLHDWEQGYFGEMFS